MARSTRLSWQRLRAIDIARAVAHGHSGVRATSLANVRPSSLPKIGKGFLVKVTEESSGELWTVFVKASALEDREVQAWLYIKTYSQNGDCKSRHLASRPCKFDDDHGWRGPSSIFSGRILSDEQVIASFQ